MNKIYTRTGDLGSTGLVGGQRISKHHIRLEAYGTIDELNSQIGMMIAHTPNKPILQLLNQVQHTLFDIGSYLATDASDAPKLGIPHTRVEALEEEIDRLDNYLPPLTYFILPAGSIAIAQAHICRTVCRRAERCVIHLSQEATVDELVIKYLNRLSDYFFTLARFFAIDNAIDEIKWEGSC